MDIIKFGEIPREFLEATLTDNIKYLTEIRYYVYTKAKNRCDMAKYREADLYNLWIELSNELCVCPKSIKKYYYNSIKGLRKYHSTYSGISVAEGSID